MGKLKLFLENFIVYGLGGVISKIVPLIMVPIVTRLMPNSDYFGISDLSNTVISFAQAIAIMGMYDAMYRMFFEKESVEFKKDVCSTALIFTLGMSLLVYIVMLVCKDWIAALFFNDVQYGYIVYISAMAVLVGATNSIISAPTRMQNQRKVFLIANTVSPLLSYSIAIPMLMNGYYTIALPLAAVISAVTMECVFWVLNRSWFSLKRFDKSILRELLLIAVPLLPNFVIYWVFNSCNRIFITQFMGIGAAGVYSVSSKLGQASQLIYTAFAGGWQYFAFSTMKEKDQVKSNSLVFEYLGIISFIVTAFVCALSRLIFEILFTEEYLEGYISAPYLFLAPLMQMLFQVACNQFLVIKKTWPNMMILSAGAVISVLLNLALIPAMGIEGASIATLAGYAVSDVIAVIVLRKMKLMVISGKFIVSVAIMIAYFVAWRLGFHANTMVGTLGAVIITSIYGFVYRKELFALLNSLRKGRR